MTQPWEHAVVGTADARAGGKHAPVVMVLAEGVARQVDEAQVLELPQVQHAIQLLQVVLACARVEDKLVWLGGWAPYFLVGVEFHTSRAAFVLEAQAACLGGLRRVKVGLPSQAAVARCTPNTHKLTPSHTHEHIHTHTCTRTHAHASTHTHTHTHTHAGSMYVPRDRALRLTSVSRFSMTVIWLPNSDRSVSLVSVDRPSILVILLKDRSSQVRLVCGRAGVGVARRREGRSRWLGGVFAAPQPQAPALSSAGPQHLLTVPQGNTPAPRQ